MCLIGIALLTLKDDFSINLANLKGDMFGILCAVSYAVDLILTEKAVSREDVNAFQLGVFQLGATGIYMTFLAMNFEHLHLPTNGTVWGAVIFLSVFSTGVAFIVQTIAQQFTTASHVGIIFTLEPVFAALTAFIFAGEILTLKSYTGALILVAALFITEIDFKKLMKERR